MSEYNSVVIFLIVILAFIIAPFIVILIWNFWATLTTILIPMEHYWQGFIACIFGLPFLNRKTD